MKKTFLLLLTLISINCFAEKKEFNELPLCIRSQINFSQFKSAELDDDSWYEIKFKGFKEKEYYTANGVFESNCNHKGGKMRVIDATIFSSMVLFIVILFLGKPVVLAL